MQQQKLATARAERAEAQPQEVPATLSLEPAAAPARPDRSHLRRVLFILGPVIALLIAAALYFSGGRYVETDNAYVKANKVTISAQVSGPISAIAVRENQNVRAGEELFRVDDEPFRLALARAEAQLHTVRSEIEGTKASYRQKLEQLRLAKTNVDFAARELNRQTQLAKQKLTPQAKLDEAQHNFDTARDQVAVLEQEQAQTLTQLSGSADIPAEKHPRYLEAQASRDTAALNLEHAVVTAPFAGTASKVPQLGQYIAAGSAVMSVIATSDMWIEANFMETDLANVRVGQPVKIRVDTYSGREWHGSVQSIAQATGAEFSVLPPQNASGNWVKVVQRIPVRIAIAAAPNDPPLRVGMTTAVEIDTGAHHSLAKLLHLSSQAAQ